MRKASCTDRLFSELRNLLLPGPPTGELSGSGGGVATLSLAPSAEEIALHEMGHTAFSFADEYCSYEGCGIDTGFHSM